MVCHLKFVALLRLHSLLKKKKNLIILIFLFSFFRAAVFFYALKIDVAASMAVYLSFLLAFSLPFPLII